MLFRPPFRTPIVPVLVCALVLTACSAEEPEETGPEGPAPSAISPDTVVTCEENGDCGEQGAVRWSLPLEGEYVMGPYQDEPPIVLPQEQAATSDYPFPGAAVHDGVLYYHEHEQLLAFDPATAEPLWAEEVDPERSKSVDTVQPVGDRLVMFGQQGRDRTSLTYLLDTTEDGVEWELSDVEPATTPRSEVPANGTHVLLTTERNSNTGQDRVHTLLDATTGQVEWETLIPGHINTGALSEDHLFSLERSGEDSDDPDLVHRVDLADGQVLEEFPVPEDLDDADKLTVSDDGMLVAGDAVMDSENGELLWTLDPSTEFHRFEEGDPALLHLGRGSDHWLADARTGEEVDGQVPDPLPESFVAENAWFHDSVDTSELDPDTSPLIAEGPGVERFEIDLAAGARHLVSYQADEGDYVGVYQGCAPDGVRELGWESPTGGPECTAPRLFAVDYGVAGSAPQ